MSNKIVFDWYKAKLKLDEAKELELKLRMEVVAQFFDELQEGTNKAENDKYTLVVVQPYTRTIDAAAYKSIKKDLVAAGIKMGDLVVEKPELKVAAYRKLTKEQLAIFDDVLTTKPGMPSLTVKPKGKSNE